jgi:hypothetical protein
MSVPTASDATSSRLGGAASWPVSAYGQQLATPVVGYLGAAMPELFTSRLRAFRPSLNTGRVKGRDTATLIDSVFTASSNPVKLSLIASRFEKCTIRRTTRKVPSGVRTSSPATSGFAAFAVTASSTRRRYANTLQMRTTKMCRRACMNTSGAQFGSERRPEQRGSAECARRAPGRNPHRGRARLHRPRAM